MRKMRLILGIVLVAMMFIAISCSKQQDKLTGVPIHELKVPQDFDYGMSRQVTLNINGDYRLPLTIKTTDGNVLLNVMMNPERGIQAKLEMPHTVNRVVVSYQRHELTLPINGNRIVHTFN